MILAMQLLLLLLVLGFVLIPLLRDRGVRVETEPTVAAHRRVIAEQKARLYGALLELDFDRDSGKLSAEDHARMREEIMAEVVQVLAEEEKFVPRMERRPVVLEGGDKVERMIEEYKRARRKSAEVRTS